MDPFLPGQIEMMVLRYLIVNKCEASALKLIEEMHNLKNFIPAKPAKFSDTAYLKHLMRLPGTPALKEMLWDFGNSRILADEMLYNEEEEMLISTESLLDKLKMVQEKLKNVSQEGSSSVTTSNSQQEVEKFASSLPVVEKVDNSTNTEDYECSKCLASRLKVKSESGCQTEEYTAVQFGLQNDIPVVFCETLLNDNTLQQKIAQTINEHMQDPQGEANDISKISSKAVTEIDKFLVDFLKDLPDDSNSIPIDTGLFQNLGVASVVEIENNLSSMFGVNVSPVANQIDCPGNPEHSNGLGIGSSASHMVESQPTASSGAAMIPAPSISTTPKNSSSNACEVAQTTPNNSSEFRNMNDLIPPPSGTSTPNRSQRHQSIKRITPTPLSNAHANPIFNESILVEKKTVEIGDKRAKMSVITRNIETPDWQKLHRRSIAPKIPGLTPQSNVPVVKHQDFGDVLRLGADRSRSEIKQVVHPRFSPSTKLLSNKRVISTSSPMSEKISHPPSANKRKATPVKLSPEKANEKSFILYYPENHNKSAIQQSTTKSSESGVIESTPTNKNVARNESRIDVESSVKKTPVPSSSAPNDSENLHEDGCKLVLSNENSQHDVTPMQPPPPAIDACSSSTLKTISPNALKRLIASANRIGTTTTFGNFCNKKKSFSTPRKRKHVRNLSFATPPSLKGVTPGSEPPKGGLGTSQKRKASEDLFSVELRSKKRLNWPDSEKKNKDGNSVASIISRRASDSVVLSSTTELHSENSKLQNCNSNNEDRQAPNDLLLPANTNKVVTVSGVAPKQSMPTIAEESMSNTSVNTIQDPPQTVVLPVNYQHPFYTTTSQAASNNSSNELPSSLYAVSTVLNDGTTKWEYFQVCAETGELVLLDPPPVPEQSVSKITQEKLPSGNESSSLTFCSTAVGFPDPTPIKNFNGCLNISDITCSSNGPLITPFKTVPPPGLNETHFTLPPTPRVIMDDNDSNSNFSSGNFLKLDSAYSMGLWTSTPLKPGIPRTPGRGSSSSNSQSPTGKTNGLILSSLNVEQNQADELPPQPQLPISLQTTQTFVRPEPDKNKVANTISSNAAKTATTALVLSPLLTHDKSDGEISSSDDEVHAKPCKKAATIPQKSPTKNRQHNQLQTPPVLQNHPQVSSASSSSSSQHHHRNRPLPRPPPLHPLPHISVSLNQNLKHTHGINFHVGGREKLLTMSEQETLYSLISMGSIGNAKADVTRKENPTRSVVNRQHHQVTPAAPVPLKPTENEPVAHHNRPKRKNLDLNRLIKIVREKNK